MLGMAVATMVLSTAAMNMASMTAMETKSRFSVRAGWSAGDGL